jgi:glycosyltransferase involved in cell wall biosynthesis
VHGVGDNRIIEKEARTLAASGWEVVAIMAHDATEVMGAIRVVGVRRRKRRLARVTVAAFQTLLAALRESADVYHFHDPELIPVGLCLRALGHKVVYDVHETNSASVAYKSYIPRWIRPTLASLIRIIELRASSYFSGIVAATPAISEQFRAIPTPRVTVQNFPKLDPAQRDTLWDDRGQAAIYAGMVSESRGLLEMVDAVNLLDNSFSHPLILAGPIMPDALVKAQGRPGWKRVSAIGKYSIAELPDLLANARVGLVVFRPLSNHLDSYPTKLFEYMAAGLPVIASNFPLWRSIVGDYNCGLLVDPLDPEDIARAIQYLLTNDDVAKQMGARARELVWSNYNWVTEGRKLVAFYDHLRAEQ